MAESSALVDKRAEDSGNCRPNRAAAQLISRRSRPKVAEEVRAKTDKVARVKAEKVVRAKSRERRLGPRRKTKIANYLIGTTLTSQPPTRNCSRNWLGMGEILARLQET